MKSALIVGGGLIGASAAFRLQRAGLACTLIDDDQSPQRASFGNAGRVATEEVEPLASWTNLRALPRMLFRAGGPAAFPPREIAAWLPFGLRLIAAARRSRQGMRALGTLQAETLPAWRRLVRDIGAPDLLRENGHFVVWESDRAAARGRARWARAATGPTRFRDATPEEWRLIGSAMRKAPAGAIRFQGSAQIDDLARLAERMAAAFAAAGGARRTATAAALTPGGVRLADGERLTADLVLIASGPGSAALLKPLGHRVPMIAERGYHVESAATHGPDDLPPILFEERAMVVTRFRRSIRATSFVEFAHAKTPPDPAKWRRLNAHVDALGLPFAHPRAEWMGARPTLPDYLPAIGRSRRMEGLLYAFGHQHLGLTLAAATAEAVAALATGAPSALDLSPFDLERFA